MSPPESAESPERRTLRRLDQYELLEKLGEGGMGTVFKARHSRLNQTVAVKVLREDLHQDPEAAGRFRREMEVLGRLDHPNIVRAADAGEADGVHYLVTEFVDGIDLGGLVDNQGRLPVADACEIIRQAALGLQHAHELGLVHRDIKPANLMIARTPSPRGGEGRGEGQPTVKLLDLGLARLQGEQSSTADLTATGQVLGTLGYMAPEQTDNVRTVDIRSDIYSLGCTLYKLLTGQPPFGGAAYNTPVKKTIGHALRKPPALSKFRSDVPDDVSAVLDRMLAKEPRDRFATPAQLAEALAPFTDGCNLPRLLDPSNVTSTVEPETADKDGTTDPRRSAVAHSTGTISRQYTRPVIAAVCLSVLIGGIWFAVSKSGSDASNAENRNGASPPVAVDPSDEIDHSEPQTVDLFNGQDLTDWIAMRSSGTAHSPAPDENDWIIRDGVLVCNTTTPGWLKSDRQYGDFVLELDFKLPPRGNSGVYLRSPGEGNLSRTGMEIQIVEESTWESELRLDNRTGAIWQIAGHRESVQKPVGEWNTMQMRCEGDVIQVTLNGTMVLDATVAEYVRPQSGFLGISNWQGQANGTEFRNIRIRELSPFDSGLPPELATPWTTKAVPAVLVPDPAKIPGIHRWQMDTVYPRGAFMAVAWHPSKPWIACGTCPGQLRIYDANDGTLIQLFIDIHKHLLIRNIAWSPDGRFLAMSRNWGIKVWDVETWEPFQITGRWGVAWSPDSTRLAVGMDGPIARICTLDDVTEVEVDLGSPVRSIAWSSDGKLIAAGTADGNISTWEDDGRPGPLLKRLHKKFVRTISFNHDSTLIATTSNDDGIGYFTLDGSSPARLDRSPIVNSVSWNPHDNRIAMPSWNGDVQIRNADDTLGPLLKAPPQPLRHPWHTRFTWDPTGEWIAVGCVDTGLRVWKSDGSSQRTISGPAASTYSVDWNSQAGLILAAGQAPAIRAWQIDGRAIGGIGDIPGYVNQCVWSPDGKEIAAVCSDDTVRLLSPDGTPRAVINSANVACWHPTDDAVIVADPAGTVRVHSTDGSQLAVLGEHENVSMLATNPKHNLIASAASGGSVRLWNLETSTNKVFEKSNRFRRHIEWSPDGEWLASFEAGANVGLWRKDGTAVPALKSKSPTSTGCWLPANKLLAATFAYPNRVDALYPFPDSETTMEPLLETSSFIGHTAPISSLDAVEPGGRFVSCSNDNTIRLWNIETGKEEWIAVILPEGKSVTIDRTGHILDMDRDAEKHLVYIVEREPGKPELMSFDEFHELAGPASGWTTIAPMADAEPGDAGTEQQSNPRSRNGLLFDGEKSHVSMQHIPFDEYDAFTVEAWVYGWEGRIFTQGKQGDPENMIWLSLVRGGCGWEVDNGQNYSRPVPPTRREQWEHVALVFDGKTQHMYLNGVLVYAIAAPKPGPLDSRRLLIIGAQEKWKETQTNPTGFNARGVLGSFRVSRIARYKRNFTPGELFKADADTLALFTLSEPNTDELIGASEHKVRATIHDAEWMVKE